MKNITKEVLYWTMFVLGLPLMLLGFVFQTTFRLIHAGVDAANEFINWLIRG